MQRQAAVAAMEAEARQELDGARTGSDTSLQQQREGIRAPQPPTLAVSGSGDSNARAGVVDGGGGEALTAGDAGSNDDCSGDDYSIHSLDIDADVDSVSQEVADNNCHASETHTDAGGTCSADSGASDSTYICSDCGKRVGSICDKSLAGDDDSGAVSDAWDSDSSKNCKPVRKSARIAGLANGIPRRRAAPASGALQSRSSTCRGAGDAAGTGEAKDKSNAKHPQPKQQHKLCQHGRQPYSCKDCGGAGICQHGRRRRTCKDCGGADICQHGRERRRCKDCGGAEI
eukprot:TRINITY_DN3617_c0_g1_i1.p1 TRINITY_DN3617_c0_g1~~TRINITY_DN3617_c0_g1_i1.p1  ORF type:complete len:287 (+),score=55.69 TRINITY_DN3617_c0_g1_i1:1-861(+)